MTSYAVTHTRKDRDGDILVIGAKGSWSKSKSDAIWDIKYGQNAYHVAWPEKTTEIKVVPGRTGDYLRTDRDNTTKNNLDDLPDF